MTSTQPIVLFLCVHNAGRSQMALGWFNHLADGHALALSGGSEPAAQINPTGVAAMAEVGIDIAREYPKPWTSEGVGSADVVVTMGCGDTCPYFPGTRYEDWELDDPAGQGIEAVRKIRDDIERRVRDLLSTLRSTRWLFRKVLSEDRAGASGGNPGHQLQHDRVLDPAVDQVVRAKRPRDSPPTLPSADRLELFDSPIDRRGCMRRRERRTALGALGIV